MCYQAFLAASWPKEDQGLSVLRRRHAVSCWSSERQNSTRAALLPQRSTGNVKFAPVIGSCILVASVRRQMLTPQSWSSPTQPGIFYSGVSINHVTNSHETQTLVATRRCCAGSPDDLQDSDIAWANLGAAMLPQRRRCGSPSLAKLCHPLVGSRGSVAFSSTNKCGAPSSYYASQMCECLCL